MSIKFSRRRLLQASASLTTLPSFENVTAGQATPEPVAPQKPLIRMSPQPGSQFALPATTVSFRDISPDELGTVYVTGSLSGPASGILKIHSDGRGTSWVHDATFFEGETVTVRADIPITTSADGAASFVIGHQASRRPTGKIEDRTSASSDASKVHTFKSRPDLAPVKIDIEHIDETRVSKGLIAVTPQVPNGQAGVQLVNNAGETVWYYTPKNENFVTYCLKMQMYYGEPVLTWAEAGNVRGWGYGHYVIVDQSYETIATVHGGHGVDGLDVHDLVLTDYGTAWAFSYNSVYIEDAGTNRNVIDCVIQEIDVSTGDVWWEWHSLDHVALDESFSPRPADPDHAWDYIHVNSIEVDYDDGLLISSRTNHAIYKIDTTNHKIVWRLGGKKSDFPLEPEAVFAWQHDARRLADGRITLFDNVDSDQTANARGMVFELDEDAMTAELVQVYHHPLEMHSPYQANMQTLDNGHVFIGWGSGPRCSEFTPAGEMIFDMRYRSGVSYRGYRVNWLGNPSQPVDYSVELAADGSLALFVSWNGATNVAAWRVIGGAGPATAVELARSSKAGFETQLSSITPSAYMEIQALGADGLVLGGRQVTIYD